MASSAFSVHPSHALAVYAESLAEGAMVAVFGDASEGLGSRLAVQGAHAVHVWDPDFARARLEAGRAPLDVTVHPYSDDVEADVRGIDLAIVGDLGLFADPAALIANLRRMLGDTGVAVIAASSDAAPTVGSRAFDYYELFDLVAREFTSVRMVARLPFYGLALVELGGDDESAVSVDTQLGDSGSAPEAFVVVAAQRDARLEPYSIVQLPAAAFEVSRSSAGQMRDPAHSRESLLELQVQDLRARVNAAERAVDDASATEETLRVSTSRLAESERALAARGRELADLSSEVEEMRAAAEAGRIAASQVEELGRRADRAERRVAQLEQEFVKGSDSHSKELSRLEEALLERSKTARGLEAELVRRDQMVRDLVGTLEEIQETPSRVPAAGESRDGHAARGPEADEARALAEDNGRLRAQLDAMALDLARREGDAQAAAWQIAELGRQVAQSAADVAESGGALDARGPSHGQLLDELDALRKALTQEHEARMRAESGAELAQARAEIERQAVLMEQLARELQSRAPAGSSADSR